MSLRELVFDALKVDNTLNTLGINVSTLYANHSPDSPAAQHQRWAVIRWGLVDRPVGRDSTARPLDMELRVYDREKDFAAIDAVLKRARFVLEGLVSRSTGEGWVICADWQSGSEDGYDDVLAAVVRSETYRIVASGT